MFRLRSFIYDAFVAPLRLVVLFFILGLTAQVSGFRALARVILRPRLAPVFACVFALVTLCLLSAAAYAADIATATVAVAGTSILTTVLIAIAAQVPSLIGSGWALFKAYAAHSEATWDDWTVAAVEKTCRGVLEKSGWTLTPPQAGPAKGP
ncbi:hypothetical protein [Hypericibacter sp.]|uniref:hypothetical protein n=1 Tax=Hypericibacter sp. TaxID=2705401 RepID=UPI003D6D28A3